MSCGRPLLFTVLFAALLFTDGVSVRAKEAELAGTWYPAKSRELKGQIERYLTSAYIGNIDGDTIGVVAPHAGMRFSGEVAAYAFKAVQKKSPRVVVLVGFSHKKYFPGRIAVLADDKFSTPVGDIYIDRDLTERFLSYNYAFQDIPEAFSQENSIEMEIPFIQVAAPGAKIVALAIGDQRIEVNRIVADALSDILADIPRKDFVVVASTDMCHYLPYDAARKADASTIEALLSMDPENFYRHNMKAERNEGMCGTGAVYAVMKACKNLGATEVRVLKYANSGDTWGSKQSVVGYLSAAFIEPSGIPGDAGERTREGGSGMFDTSRKKELLTLARHTIENYLATGRVEEARADDPLLNEDMGAFVTLHKNGRLRGCIGHMAATKPLYDTVKEMAIAAATQDPRFPRVTPEEMKDIDIEISVLTPMRKIDDPEAIEVGKHGVMVRRGFRSGVYLPQVADETGWDREQFMDSLCAHKAGIPADSWRTGDCDIFVFTAEVFGEKDTE